MYNVKQNFTALSMSLLTDAGGEDRLRHTKLVWDLCVALWGDVTEVLMEKGVLCCPLCCVSYSHYPIENALLSLPMYYPAHMYIVHFLP